MIKNDYFNEENLLQLCKYINELFRFINPERVELVISEDEDFTYLHVGIAVSDLTNPIDLLDEGYLEECVDMINKRLMFYSESDIFVGTILFFSKNACYTDILSTKDVLKGEEYLEINCKKLIRGYQNDNN